MTLIIKNRCCMFATNSILSFSEDQELTENIVQNYDNDIGKDLHNEFVEFPDINCDIHDHGIENTGGKPEQEEHGDLDQNAFPGRDLAFKDPFTIRNIGKKHRRDPGNNGRGNRVDVKNACADVIDDKINSRCEDAEYKVKDDMSVFFQELCHALFF